ncbi:hypothetical protein B0I37DRAFT_392672 [Chaetomium sp. MPI-CAGE-AT-0009]|nr:hypothetical protein B0I37DRAFT_392672 [Chaetomium sp. MPI-CAGE-AT-0009]
MTSLIDERFLAKLMTLGAAETPHFSDQEPFWLLGSRPARSAPSLFPFSTHQRSGTPPGREGEFSFAVDNATYHSMLDAEMDIMPPWEPQDLSNGGPDNGLANPAVPHPPPPSRFKVSQGDALLLNIMDCQRTSADEWMDLLQNQAAGDGSVTSTDAEGEVSGYEDGSESESADDMWRSEDEDENPMVDMQRLLQRSGTPVRR